MAARDFCGDSTLEGHVDDAGSSQPIPDATVTALAQGSSENDRHGTTNGAGYYNLPVNGGEVFDVTASSYGYYEQTFSDVSIPAASVITQDFNLASKPGVTLSGTVTDGGGHGYPLYAQVLIEAEGYSRTAFTDPLDGTYQVSLFADTPYDMTVTALVGGYTPAADTGVVFSAPTDARNFSLQVDAYCEAPGYVIVNGLLETFPGTTLPAGWMVQDHAGTGVVWRFDDPDGRGNITGGTGNFAIADSDYVGQIALNTSLISPSIDFSGQGTVILSFDQDFYYYSDDNPEKGDVDISINGGAWQNVLRQTAMLRGPNHQEIDISALAGNQPDVRVRFHYYDANFDWWWQVDNVSLGPYTCALAEGGVVTGFTNDDRTGEPVVGARIFTADASTLSKATPADPEVADGFFWLFQPTTTNPQTVAVTVSGGTYQSTTTDVVVTRDALTRQDFMMETRSIFLPLILR